MNLRAFVREEFGEAAVVATQELDDVKLAEVLYLWGADNTNGQGSLGYRANSAACIAGLRMAPMRESHNLDGVQRDLYRALGGNIEFTVRMFDPLHEDVERVDTRELRASPQAWTMSPDELEAVLEHVCDSGHDGFIVGQHRWFAE